MENPLGKEDREIWRKISYVYMCVCSQVLLLLSSLIMKILYLNSNI